MSTTELELRAHRIAENIGEKHPTFEGFDVRADAGEPGMVYVALRQAKREVRAGERFAGKLESLVKSEIDDASSELGFAISLGQGNQDLLLQIELRES